MTRYLLPAFALLMFCPPARPATRPEVAAIYVSLRGNDAWSGRRGEPTGKDGPVATLKRAQEILRQVRKAKPNLDGPATIYLQGGTYTLTEPLVLEPEDSGSEVSPTIFRSYRDEKVIVSGGVRLTGWTIGKDGLWRLTIPDVAAGKWWFQQLFADDRRCGRARLPKTGYYQIEEALPPSPASAGKGYDRFKFKAGELSARWRNLTDVEALVFQTWTMARLPIKEIDETPQSVTFSGHTAGLDHWAALPKGNRFLVENVREALTQPGEFYLDRKSGELTYFPRPGENPKRTVMVAPRVGKLVEIRGNAEAKRWVQHVQFIGITFSHSNWTTPAGGNASSQAEAVLGGAVSAVGARDCVFEKCAFEHLGQYALELGTACKRNVVKGCRLTDLGAGGVKIGHGGAPEDDDLVASHNTVEGCLIAHGGRMHPAAVGVYIGHSHDNRIVRNEICDLYYTGVSVGWSWGYGRSLAHHNLVERNHIHDIGQGVLSDMGGIYTLGLSPGSALRENRIHDVESFEYGGWGIYPDEGTTGMLIENNIVFRCKSATFHQHYGKDNVVRNNVFAFGRGAQLMRSREEEHSSFTMERNIILWKEGDLLGSYWSNGHFRLDNNLYWNGTGKPFSFAGLSLEDWRKKGQDVHSVIADPLFVDPDRGDFRLEAGSPALKLGFVPIDVSVAAPPRKNEPLAPPAFPIVKR